MSLKAYVGFVNEGFDDFEGTRSIWEVTKVAQTPDIYTITPNTTQEKTINTNNNSYIDTTTTNHCNNHIGATNEPNPVVLRPVDNLRVQERRKMPVPFREAAVDVGPMDTITEEMSSWSQESIVI